MYDRFENGRRVVNVVELVIHPDWDPVSYANDIALLRLANVVQFTGTYLLINIFASTYHNPTFISGSAAPLVLISPVSSSLSLLENQSIELQDKFH